MLHPQVNTERSIRHAMQERLPIVVVINKVSGFFTCIFDTMCFCPFLGFSSNISKVISAVILDCEGRASGSGFSGYSVMLL